MGGFAPDPGRLQVILPARDYRARKVAPDNAAEFDRLLAAAAGVTVVGFERCCRHAYMAASDAMLDAVDTVIAVWDGQPARRHGSTADVVAAARRRGIPATILWPTGAARHPAPALAADPRAVARAALLVVLDGVVFPVQRWELVMHAEHYGADRDTRTLLARLPEGTYADLAAVLVAVGHDRS